MIHPTAIVDPSAKLGSEVSVGPYTIIGPNVEIADHTEIAHHVTLEGPTSIGPNCQIFPYTAIGLIPQDKKYYGESSRLEIGSDTVIREFVTINRGTEAGGGITKIGDRCWIMAYCHIAHDCHLGNDIVASNNTTLGGHVTLGNFVTTGGFTAIHQFCSIGDYAFTGAQSMITQDVAPYVMAVGNRAKLSGINKVGLGRNNFSPTQIQEILKAYKIFFQSALSKEEALTQIEVQFENQEHIQLFVDFIKKSQRGVCR